MKITRKMYYVINFVLLFAVLIVAFVSATVIMYQAQKKLAEEKMQILTLQARDDLNDTLERVETLSRTMFLNSDFQDLADGIYTDSNALEGIYDHFNLLISMDDIFKNAIYVPRNTNGELDVGNAVSYGRGYEYILTNVPNILEMAGNYKDGRLFFTRLYYVDGTDTPYFAVSRNIYDIRPESYLEKMGVGILFLNAVQLADKLNSYSVALNGLSFCVMENGDKLAQTSQYTDEALEGNGYYVKNTALDNFSWWLVSVYDKSYIWDAMKNNFAVLVVVISVAGVSCIVLAAFVRRKSSESLDYLFNVFSNLESNNAIDIVPYSDDQEVNQVIDSFNRLVGSVRNLNDEMLKQKNRELKLELRNTEYMLNSLHSQINKHFLINILSLVRSFITCKETEKAKNCIEDLSDFLRGTLTLGDKTTVGEELAMVRSYLNIQASRYPRVETEINCPAEIMGLVIPKMILQPVIENAFIHGLQRKKGKIQIIGRVKNNFIYFFVSDNGQGIDIEKRKEINQSLKERKKITFALGNGIALSNIEQRLRLLAGEKSLIRLISKKGHGTVAMLKIYKGEDDV